MREPPGSGIPRERRFSAGLPAILHHRGTDHPCRAHDLSRTGALLRGTFPDPSTPMVELTLSSLTGDVEVRLRGRVVRSSGEAAEPPREIAVEFAEPARDQREAIEVLVARVVEGQLPAPLESLPPDAPPGQVVEALRGVPQAHRVALAARGNRRERDILSHDPHADVLAALARNPNLLATEIRDLVGRPHLSAATLRAIAADPRWAGDPEIRQRIVVHPHAPLALAESLADAMDADQAARLAVRPGVPSAVRAKLARRVGRGRRG